MPVVIKRRKLGDIHKLPDTIPPVLRRIYSARGVDEPKLLEKRLQQLLPPQDLKGIDKAVVLLIQALEANQRITIVGDFDCDGATSCALMMRVLKAMGASHVGFLVPDRFQYGYGLSPEIVKIAQQEQTQLLITVDNGISCHAGVDAAKTAGMRVIVTDHHLPGDTLPKADAIVNPNQPDCTFASKAIAGVGVAFYVLLALRAALRQRSWFQKQHLEVPNLADYLDLVALGTVADVVPLDHNNRILVHQGMQRIRAGQACAGIQALIEVSHRHADKMTTSDLGFALGPRLNAVGRLDNMSLGINCLLSESLPEARELAQYMDALNQKRKNIEQDMQLDARHYLDTYLNSDDDLPVGFVLFQPNWHQGVVGLVASKLKERYFRPVIAFALSDDETQLKGSGRSIPGLHLRDVLQEVQRRHPHLIQKFGGHAMAVGLSLQRDALPEFETAFMDVLQQQLADEQLTQELLTDGILRENEINIELAQYLRHIEPWGQHFPEPTFDGEFRVMAQRLVGENHLKLQLCCLGDARNIDAIAFQVDVEQWPNPQVKRIQCVYRLDVNEWRGQRKVQLCIQTLTPIEAPKIQEKNTLATS